MVSDDGTLNPNELGASEVGSEPNLAELVGDILSVDGAPVSYTHLRAHET